MRVTCCTQGRTLEQKQTLPYWGNFFFPLGGVYILISFHQTKAFVRLFSFFQEIIILFFTIFHFLWDNKVLNCDRDLEQNFGIVSKCNWCGHNCDHSEPKILMLQLKLQPWTLFKKHVRVMMEDSFKELCVLTQ